MFFINNFQKDSYSSNLIFETFLLFISSFKCDFVLLCLTKWLFLTKLVLQRSHLNDLFQINSPVCIFLCGIKELRSLNAFEQTSHLNGFSFVWTRLCLVSAECWTKVFEQVEHAYGRSPEWMRACVVRVYLSVNVLKHISHWCGLNNIWIDRMCNFNVCFVVYDFEHI